MMHPDQTGRPPSEQWWTINGDAIIHALREAHSGTDPQIVYLGLFANSESHDYGSPT